MYGSVPEMKIVNKNKCSVNIWEVLGFLKTSSFLKPLVLIRMLHTLNIIIK